MDNGLFRKKSMDRISSPESLHDYMRVTSPRLWMILAAIVLILGGFIVYASTAKMENTIPIRVMVETYHMTAEETGDTERDATMVYSMMTKSQVESVKIGMELRVLSNTGRVSWITTGENEDANSVVFEMDPLNYPMKDGEYDAELVLESTTPISFLWN